MRSDPVLWERIDKYNIDDPEANFAFTDRLKRDNGWDERFTARAIDEYKRFIYLACTSGHEVTPSQDVDEVWHLHLLYTHSYWVVLCATVLLRPLHHGPTKGGEQEGDRYRENYRATLTTYEREFGERPPPDLWPDMETRFTNRPECQRVDSRHHWIVRKPPSHIRWLLLGATSAVLGSVFMASAASINVADARTGGQQAIGLILFMAAFIFGMIALIGWINLVEARREESRKKKDGGSGCGAGSVGCGGNSSSNDGGSSGGSSGDGGGGGCGGGCS